MDKALEGKNKKREIEVWSEGFRATGQHGNAHHHGTYKGTSLKEVCDRIFKDDQYYNAEYVTYWGCRLFDSESEARKTYG